MSELHEARATLGRMRNAATGFLENLSVEQRARAMFDFADEAERRDWDFVPKQGRNGLPIKDMDYRQQQLAHFLITAGLSTPGYAKVVSIMAFESVLRELQKERMGRDDLPEVYELGFDHYRLSEHDRQALKYVRSEPRGLPGSDMDDAQRALLTAAIECFISRMPDEVATKQMEKVQQAGIESFYFAWAGPQELH